MKCPNCLSSISSESSYCKNCGYDFSSGQIDSQHRRVKGWMVTMMYYFLTIYGVLYLFIAGPYFCNSSHEPWVVGIELICIKLMLLLFLVGYLIVWKNELIGGAIFILWFVAILAFSLLIVAPLDREWDWRLTIVGGFPVFVLGILFVMIWHRGRRSENT